MPIWFWIMLFAALIKIPVAGLMLWIPFRDDEAMQARDAQDSSEEDGGTKALPAGPKNPHPRTPLPRHPRRGPHGSPTIPSPPRVRTAARSTRRVERSRARG